MALWLSKTKPEGKFMHFVAGRILLGVASGAFATLGPLLIADICPMQRRGCWMGYVYSQATLTKVAKSPKGFHGILPSRIGSWHFVGGVSVNELSTVLSL